MNISSIRAVSHGLSVIHYSVSIADEWLVHLEEGVNQEVAEELRRRGQKVKWPVTGTSFYYMNKATAFRACIEITTVKEVVFISLSLC